MLGAKMLSDHNGGLVLVPGMATLLAELATSLAKPRVLRWSQAVMRTLGGSARARRPG